MKNSMKSALLLMIAAALSPACSKKSEQVPPSAPMLSQPAPAPVAPVAPPPAPIAAPAPSFEGEWKGESGTDLPLNFTIEGNKVSSFYNSYSGRSGSCSFSGGISNSEPATLQGNNFSISGEQGRDGNPIEFMATGTLTSPTEASGTVVWKGKSSICGDINLQYQWKAKKEAPPPPDAENSDG